MLALIFTILFSATVAYFATQNTEQVTLHFLTYTWSDIPLYLVILFSLFTGLLFAWLLHVLKTISFSLILRGKNKALKAGKLENLELTKKVHKLELQNTELSTKEGGKSYVEDNSL